MEEEMNDEQMNDEEKEVVVVWRISDELTRVYVNTI